MTTMHISRMAPADIVNDLDADLRNLRVETIDLYYLHRDNHGGTGGRGAIKHSTRRCSSQNSFLRLLELAH